jgi:hypothetical protein
MLQSAIGGRYVHRQQGRTLSVPPDPSGKVVARTLGPLRTASVMRGVAHQRQHPTIMIAKRIARLVRKRAMSQRTR